ncbi:uncharacterized protein LOC114951570 [Acropora millepora]|uniref:uncharacterized protein LOC114951570 n=1 Tax=Acropora millepora TaxID=45264 RepID=UPI001CF38C6C|nr:uncharacterized protein LOC114951570 [Acropora millepora]
MLSLSDNAVGRVFRSLEDVCSIDIGRNPIVPFAGRCLVKCVESKFNHKPKYNRGRRTSDAWVFGVISCDTRPSRGYYEVVENRNHATLLPILPKCLQPGSEVHTDDWGAYDNLEQHLPHLVLRHRIVVHADNFVDPATGVHTQEAESAWAALKGPIKQRRGISREDLQVYLDERMWRQWRGLNQIIANFIPVLASQYMDYVA